jgi:hypothetical protein
MADNFQLPEVTTSGDVAAGDEIAGVKYQRIKLTLGADGVNDGDVSATNPLPISGGIADGAASSGDMLLVGGQTAGGIAQVFETNGSGHLHISDGGGSITVDSGSGSLATIPASQTYLDVSFSQVISNNVQSDFTLVQTGAGMTVNQSAGNLVITAGTTTNSETLIRSVQTFTGNLSLFEVTTLSQRNANNNFYIELVDYPFGTTPLSYTIVSATSVDVTINAHGYTAADVGRRMDIGKITGAAGIPMVGVIASIPSADTIRFTVAGWPASGSGTCLLWGLNKIETQYTGAGATVQNVLTRRLGYENTSTAVTSTTTAAAKITQVDWVDGDAQWSDNPITAATLNLAKRAQYRTNIPQPSTVFYLHIRAKNGTSAPTATTWTLGMVRIEGITSQKTSITTARIGQGMPVTVISAPTTTVTGTVTVTSTTLAAAVANVGYVGLQIPLRVADVASAALTTTTTTAAFTPTFGTTYVVNIPVTAVSGTSPTLDVVVQESDDDGTNWFDVYAFPRITATGMYRSPPLTLRGNRVRYVQTVGGTTPSFTRAINRLQRNDDAPLRAQFIDRTIVPNTLNSVTPTFYIEGFADFNLTVRCTAQTTPATMALRFSNDGTNWFNTATTLATVVGVAQAKYTNEQWKFVQGIVTVAGSGITLGEAVIVGRGT